MRRGNLFWGVVLIAGGGLLLLDSLDLLGSINVWGLIWPLGLILFGIWAIVSVMMGSGSSEVEELEVPLEGAQSAQVKLQFGGGRLRAGGGARSGMLLEGNFVGGIHSHVKREGDSVRLRLTYPSGRTPPFFLPWRWGSDALIQWDMALNEEVPLELAIESGASEASVDLTTLQVRSVRLETGASSTVVKLPEAAGHTAVKIEAGAASVSLEVPPGVAGRLRVQGALAGVDIDRERFPRRGEVYQSLDYEEATHKVDVDIELGAGSIKVV